MLRDRVTLWTGWIRRHLNGNRHERLTRAIGESIDTRALQSVRRGLGTVRGVEKFADFESWLVEAVRRFDQYGLLDLRPGTRLLDIGCGAGHTLLVAERLGFEATGIDVPDEEILNKIIEILGVRRMGHRFRPYEAVCDLGGPFDVVTIFMTTLNKLADGTPWHCDHWEFFLRDIRRHMTRDGMLIVKFNVNKMIGAHYPPDVWPMVRELKMFDGVRFRDTWILRAR